MHKNLKTVVPYVGAGKVSDRLERDYYTLSSHFENV